MLVFPFCIGPMKVNTHQYFETNINFNFLFDV